MSSSVASFKNSSLLFGGGQKKNKTKEVDVESKPPTVNTVYYSTLSRHLIFKNKKLPQTPKLVDFGMFAGTLIPFVLLEYLL